MRNVHDIANDSMEFLGVDSSVLDTSVALLIELSAPSFGDFSCDDCEALSCCLHWLFVVELCKHPTSGLEVLSWRLEYESG